jgi:HK97 family phage portal protein
VPNLWEDIRGAIGGAVALRARRVADAFEAPRRQASVPRLVTPTGRPLVPGQALSDGQEGKPHVKALFDDPMNLAGAFGFKDRTSGISFNMMRDILYRLPIISNIVQLRVEQVASFGHVSTDSSALGFSVKMRDKKQVPTDAESNLCKRFETFFLRTGSTNTWMGRDSFEAYLRKITRDALVFDQNCTELVPGNNGKPCEFYAIDAANVRLARNLRGYTKDGVDDATAYVELHNEAIRSRFTADEMIFGIRNPSTDIRLNGYGTSELEYLMPTLTQMIYALDYNGSVFTNGTLARGILNIRDEDLTDKDLNQIERQWNNMLKGAENAWRTPVIAARNGVDWINLQGATDTQFASWIDFLIKVACSAYKVSPEELNFSYGTIGQSSSLSEPNNRDKITESKERGLRPLLRHIEGNINRHILWRHCPDLKFEFVGLDAMTPEERVDFTTKRLRAFLTVNEARAEQDLEPIVGGDTILDGTYLQSKGQAQQAPDQQDNQGFGLPDQDAPPEQFDAAARQQAQDSQAQESSSDNQDMLGARDMMRSGAPTIDKSQGVAKPRQLGIDVTL